MIQAIRSILVLCVLVLPLPATAESPSLDYKIRYILEISDFNKVMDTTFEGLRPMMINQIKRVSNKITPELADHIANIAADEMDLMKPEFAALAANLYKKELSEEEIGALYDFYKSPVGAQVGRKLVRFTEMMIPQIQAFIGTRYVPRLQARIARDERLRSALTP